MAPTSINWLTNFRAGQRLSQFLTHSFSASSVVADILIYSGGSNRASLLPSSLSISLFILPL
jgi:hypothetical protein